MSGPSRVAITGASGFLGSALADFLRATGSEVLGVGRDARSAIRWDPAAGTIDAPALEGMHAVVHLAGSSVAERWTAARKQEIRESRVQGTRLLAESLARLAAKPAVLVCASGVGIYGSRGDEWLDETSSFGDDFLSEVGVAWEAAARPAAEAGIRVVHARTGIVLHRSGGALAKMLLPFSLGAGGKLGDGTQWMSWISRVDYVRALRHAIDTDAIVGAMNVVGPEPVTNATFTEGLGRILRRPTIATVPAIALRALFGEMADGAVLASQRVRPAVLERTGFRFEHASLSSALRAALD